MSNMAYKFNTPAAVPGDLTRPQTAKVDAAQLSASTPPTKFGVPLKFVVEDGVTVISRFTGDETAADFVGVLSRQAPSIGGTTANEAFGAGTPNPAQFNGRLFQGYIGVVCTQGTPVRGEPARIRVVADTGKLVGDWEYTPDVTAIGAATGGNTGNGTITLVTAGPDAKDGVYTIRMTAATTFTVSDPDGLALKPGTALGAYTSDAINFTLTAGGTPWAAGDTLTVTVDQKNIAIPGVNWASDGRDTDNGNRAEILVNYVS